MVIMGVPTRRGKILGPPLHTMHPVYKSLVARNQGLCTEQAMHRASQKTGLLKPKNPSVKRGYHCGCY